MDDYPAGSLDHNIPSLLTLGVSGTSTFELELSAALKDQAVLIRSELPPIEADQTNAHALLHYIQEHDASSLPCNARETQRRYRFRVKTTERVRMLLSPCGQSHKSHNPIIP